MTISEAYNLSINPIVILSIDNIFFETDIGQGLIFRAKPSGVILNFTTDVDPGLLEVYWKIQRGVTMVYDGK